MKVKEIVIEAATLLGMKDYIYAYFEDDDYEYYQQAEQLLACLHLAESSLALDYLPLYAEDEVLSTTGKVEFSQLSNSPVRIIDVKNPGGESLAYTLYPKYLKTSAGRVLVTYSYTPSLKTGEEESDFTGVAAMHVLVYGTLEEYCLANGMLQEAAIWNKKKKDSVEYLCHTEKCKRLSSRRWV